MKLTIGRPSRTGAGTAGVVDCEHLVEQLPLPTCRR
jgi:hypothetical protein